MKEKKNIDRLFQEKFKDFEAHPSSKVWENIAAAQKEKDDRKIIPLWWKLGGIAAALAILFTLGTFMLTDTTRTNNSPSLVTEETQDVPTTDQDALTSPLLDEILVSSSSDAISTEESTDELSEPLQDSLRKEPKVATTSTASTPNKSVTPKGIINNKTHLATTATSNSATAIASTSNTTAQNSIEKKDRPKAQYTNSELAPAPVTTTIVTTDTPSLSTLDSTSETTTAEIANHSPKEKDLVAEAEKIASAQNEEVLLPQDPTKKDRWGVGAVAAPVYYSDFGGSGIDPQFKDNDKTGDVNLSYGVQVSYAVTPRLKLRSGVSNVDLSYSTNGLAFSTNGLAARQLEGVNYSKNGRNIAISDASDRNILAEASFFPGADNDIAEGSLQQRLNYIEVPVEAVYTISDKRLGISVISGVSTLFLNTNEVLLISDRLNTSLGTSSSLNDVSFTTNVGLGIDYKITEDFKLNLEPALKYQINGYDNSVGEFKPYFLGVYTGISYKF